MRERIVRAQGASMYLNVPRERKKEQEREEKHKTIYCLSYYVITF